MMESVAGASAIVGLAVPVFQIAKYIRDKIKLVLCLPVCFINVYSLSMSAGRI